jgi:hypothetical protein
MTRLGGVGWRGPGCTSIRTGRRVRMGVD